MLNLRQVARRGSGEALSAAESFSRFSTVRFSPDVVGDLGAPLGHGDWAGTTVQAGYNSESTSDFGHSVAPSLPFVEQKAWEVVVKSPLATDLDIGGLVELQPSHPPRYAFSPISVRYLLTFATQLLISMLARTVPRCGCPKSCLLKEAYTPYIPSFGLSMVPSTYLQPRPC